MVAVFDDDDDDDEMPELTVMKSRKEAVLVIARGRVAKSSVRR